jgi:hypothetical protein
MWWDSAAAERKIEATPPPARSEQNTKEKCSFHFQKKSVARKSEKQGTFFFGVAERSEAVAELSSFTNF